MLGPKQFSTSGGNASGGNTSGGSGCCEPDPNTPQRAAGLNLLDSRAIGRASCFAQRFMRAGVYEYNVVPGHGQALATEYPFSVCVDEDKSPEMVQHNVLVRNEGKGFEVEPAEIRINTGDLVLWSGNGATTSAFAVVGERDFFNSSRMVNESGYSHAFGTAGEYRWVDAYGSGVGGLIRVRNPDGSDRKSLAEWRRRLEEGSLVMITDGRVDTPQLDILVGQTVFFAVVTGPGISITDERLMNLTQPGKDGKPGTKSAA